MAPTSTFNFAGRDLDANGVASMFDQPTATPSPWIDAHIPEAFSLPKLLALIALCVVGAIMVFILWRWNSVYFSDFPADHKDLLTQWKLLNLKPSDTATASTETLVDPKLAPPAPPAPAYTAAADNAAPGAEDALFHLTRANTLKNERRTVHVGVAFMPVVLDAEHKESSGSSTARGRFAHPANIHVPSSLIHFSPTPFATVGHLPFENPTKFMLTALISSVESRSLSNSSVNGQVLTLMRAVVSLRSKVHFTLSFRREKSSLIDLAVLERKLGFINQISRNGELVCFARGIELEHRKAGSSSLRPAR
ncbi:hypothetical protein C8R43DRAFT_941192 [Mycena crocata]|nr:hypothetical protein C8R43DRAFT_941192 [Mycena crocata]